MKRILITTGGSGGHVLPAITLYNHLCDNFKVFVTSDQRGKKFMSDIDINCEIVDMPNIYESILKLPINFIKLLISIIKTFIFLKKKKYFINYKHWRLYVFSFLYFSCDNWY